MNYKDLEIWKIANELVIEIHKMTLRAPLKIGFSPVNNVIKV
jgi:hypothetical protein